jgi:hypothetical protein
MNYLSKDISGKYRFNRNSMELTPMDRSKSAKSKKQIQSIKLGTVGRNILSFCHTDNTIIITHYIKHGNEYFFKYNGSTYSFSLNIHFPLKEIYISIEFGFNIDI